MNRGKKEINRKSVRVNKLLSSLYYDVNSASAYGGKENVYRNAKRQLSNITRAEVDKWLSKQETYTLHKPARKNFKRNKTIVKFIDEQWQADLCDMSSLAKDNDGYTFLLTVIDCFSKYAWAELLLNKSGDEILKALTRLLSRSKRSPKRLQTDKGTEFTNAKVQRFLRERKIEFFITEN